MIHPDAFRVRLAVAARTDDALRYALVAWRLFRERRAQRGQANRNLSRYYCALARSAGFTGSLQSRLDLLAR